MSDISTNNITDIDDSVILPNTPMMVVESGDTTLAVPLTVVKVETVEQEQADWAQTDPSAVDFIKNKPKVSTSVETRTGTAVTIASLEAFKLYQCGTITSLTVTALANGADDATIIFTAGEGFTASFPADLEWVTASDMVAGYKHVIVVCGGLAAVKVVG